MDKHHIGDLIYWFIFFLGQCLWVLICAAAAIRSKQNPINSRRAYLKANWDIFLIRFALETVFIFGIYRHYGINDVLHFLNIPWTLPISSGNSPFACFGLGLTSDVLLSSFAKWKNCPSKLKPIQAFIAERIPQLPTELVAVVKTETTVIPVAADQPAVTTTTISPVTKVATDGDKDKSIE